MIGPATVDRSARLSPRDPDIIVGYARGRTTASIARALGVSDACVKSRTQRLARHLGITGAQQGGLVHYAYLHGHLVVVRQRPLRPMPPRLTEILRCSAQGLGCRATATALGISPETVRTPRKRLHQALGVHCTARARSEEHT